MFFSRICYIVLGATLLIFVAIWPTCFSVTHWFVDHDGKIKQQVTRHLGGANVEYF